MTGVSHYVVEIVSETSASPEAVWRWLADAESWSQWTRLTTTRLERDGTPTPDGVGAIRHFGRLGGSSREEVVVFEPPRHFAYRLLRGLPISDYRSDVTLEPTDAGTRVRWYSEFDQKYPGTGPAMRLFLRGVLRDFSRRLVAQAERSSLT